MTHPVATVEQHEQELAALKLIEHPTVKAAYEQVYHHWLEILPPSDVMRACFDEAFEDFDEEGDSLGCSFSKQELS